MKNKPTPDHKRTEELAIKVIIVVVIALIWLFILALV